MSETNYDWEIHSHGDLVEYIQVIFIKRGDSTFKIQNGSSEGNQGSVYTTVYDDLADFEDFGKLEEEDDNGINKAIRRMTVKNSKENIKASGDGKSDPEAGDKNGNTNTGKQSTVDVVKETPAISAGRDPRVGKGFGFVSYFWIIVSLVLSGASKFKNSRRKIKMSSSYRWFEWLFVHTSSNSKSRRRNRPSHGRPFGLDLVLPDHLLSFLIYGARRFRLPSII